MTLDWMPAARYRRDWPRMRAFALPAFYDGRIRINLVGRESRGLVALEEHRAECDRLEALLLDCRDTVTGAPVIERIERAASPADLPASGCDLRIVWRGAPLGFDHPRLGRIGPLPYRRTCGHTGGDGAAYFAGPGLVSGNFGMKSAFDVVPTVIELLGRSPPPGVSGKGFAAEIAAAHLLLPA